MLRHRCRHLALSSAQYSWLLCLTVLLAACSQISPDYEHQSEAGDDISIVATERPSRPNDGQPATGESPGPNAHLEPELSSGEYVPSAKEITLTVVPQSPPDFIQTVLARPHNYDSDLGSWCRQLRDYESRRVEIPVERVWISCAAIEPELINHVSTAYIYLPDGTTEVLPTYIDPYRTQQSVDGTSSPLLLIAPYNLPAKPLLGLYVVELRIGSDKYIIDQLELSMPTTPRGLFLSDGSLWLAGFEPNQEAQLIAYSSSPRTDIYAPGWYGFSSFLAEHPITFDHHGMLKVQFRSPKPVDDVAVIDSGGLQLLWSSQSRQGLSHCNENSRSAISFPQEEIVILSDLTVWKAPQSDEGQLFPPDSGVILMLGPSCQADELWWLVSALKPGTFRSWEGWARERDLLDAQVVAPTPQVEDQEMVDALTCPSISDLSLNIGDQVIVGLPRTSWHGLLDDNMESIEDSELTMNVRVEIVGGPRCYQGEWFWEISTETGQRGWFRESYGRYSYLHPLEDPPCEGALPLLGRNDQTPMIIAEEGVPIYSAPGHDEEALLGYTFPPDSVWLIGGPECVNGQMWWHVLASPSGIGGWMPEGDSDKYFISPGMLP